MDAGSEDPMVRPAALRLEKAPGAPVDTSRPVPRRPYGTAGAPV